MTKFNITYAITNYEITISLSNNWFKDVRHGINANVLLLINVELNSCCLTEVALGVVTCVFLFEITG